MCLGNATYTFEPIHFLCFESGRPDCGHFLMLYELGFLYKL